MPIGRPLHCVPIACAASSITVRPWRVAQRAEAVEVDRAPGEVHGHDRAGARRDRGLGGVEVDEAGARLGVDEHRARADLLDRVGGRDERHRGDEHLVAGADGRRRAAPATARPCRTTRSGRGPRRRAPRGRARSASPWAGGDPPAAQRVDDLGDLLLADDRRGQWKEVLAHMHDKNAGVRAVLPACTTSPSSSSPPTKPTGSRPASRPSTPRPARSPSTSSWPTTARPTGRPRSSRASRARAWCAARTTGSRTPTTAR